MNTEEQTTESDYGKERSWGYQELAILYFPHVKPESIEHHTLHLQLLGQLQQGLARTEDDTRPPHQICGKLLFRRRPLTSQHSLEITQVTQLDRLPVL